MDDITTKLDRLGNLRYHVDVINLQYDALKEKILTPEILQALKDIEAERQTALEAVQAGIATLEKEVKEEVIAHGATVKGKLMKAIYVKGAERWETKGLRQYAETHPELDAFKKYGEPTVRFELIKV